MPEPRESKFRELRESETEQKKRNTKIGQESTTLELPKGENIKPEDTEQKIRSALNELDSMYGNGEGEKLEVLGEEDLVKDNEGQKLNHVGKKKSFGKWLKVLGSFILGTAVGTGSYHAAKEKELHTEASKRAVENTEADVMRLVERCIEEVEYEKRNIKAMEEDLYHESELRREENEEVYLEDDEKEKHNSMEKIIQERKKRINIFKNNEKIFERAIAINRDLQNFINERHPSMKKLKDLADSQLRLVRFLNDFSDRIKKLEQEMESFSYNPPLEV